MTNTIPTLDRYQGCLLGLALGDALCAGREGGPLERLLWRLIGRAKGLHRYTDDTQMALDLARHLIAHRRIQPDELAADFARSYRWSRGYGPSTAHVLKLIRKGIPWRDATVARHPAGSWGNGAAMRVPVVAMAFLGDPTAMQAAVVTASAVTHPHPDAIAGAHMICAAVAAGLSDRAPADLMAGLLQVAAGSAHVAKIRMVADLLSASATPDAGLLRGLGLGTTAVDSCSTAIFLALAFRDRPFVDLLQQVNLCTGDTDTVAAMAGAIWGASRGSAQIPKAMSHSIEDEQAILEVAAALHVLAAEMTTSAK